MTLITSALFLSLTPKEGEAAGRQDYCEFGERSVAILVDRTTPYDDRDKEIFVEGFDRIMARLAPGDRVTVHTIVGAYTESDIVFENCLPGCPEEGIINWMLGSCKSMIARADLNHFRLELARSIRRLLDNPVSYPYSDIARTIAQVSRQYFSRSTSGSGKPLELMFVFSDMIENSEQIPWQSLLSTDSRTAIERLMSSGLVPMLNRAEVAVFGVGRFHDKARTTLSPKEMQRLRTFWEHYLDKGGAYSLYIGNRLN